MTSSRAVLLAVVVALSYSAPSYAEYLHHARAKKAKFDLVNGSPDCTFPTETAGGGIGTAACAIPNVPGLCRFTADKGKGQFQIQRKRVETASVLEPKVLDIRVKGKAQGLNAACEGITLVPIVHMNIQTKDCTHSGGCTFSSQVGFTSSPCVVADGRCKFDATMRIQDALFEFSDDTSVVIKGCALSDVSFFNPGFENLQCGISGLAAQ